MTWLLFCLAVTAAAPERFTLSVNPLAAAAFAGRPDSRADLALGANLEYGVAAAAGWRAARRLSLETRLSGGPINQVTRVYQAQLGLSLHPGPRAPAWSAPLYAGGALRAWRIDYVHARARYLNVGGALHAGYRWPVATPWFVDARLSQWLVVTTMRQGARHGTAWMPSANPNLSPVLPMGLVEVGYRFGGGAPASRAGSATPARR